MIKIAKHIILHYGFLILMLGIATFILAGPEVRLISEYLVHIMFGFFISGIVFLIIDQKKLLISSFAIAGMLCVVLKNESNTDLVTPEVNSNPKISLSHYNLSNIDNPFELAASIQKEDSDIISFQELTPDWYEILKAAIGEEYIYQTSLVRIDPYGKAVFSKMPIIKVDTINQESFEDLKVECQLRGNRFTLYSTYVTPALDQASSLLANEQLSNVAKSISNNKIPTLAFGEYNMVYWADEISNFRASTSLKNSRKDILPASFKLPYEHIFYSNTLDCIDQRNVMSNQNKKLGYKGTYQFKGMMDAPNLIEKKS